VCGTSVDADIGGVMTTRYVTPVLTTTGGDAVLRTIERYLGNDRARTSLAETARPGEAQSMPTSDRHGG
jgi:hypothetical protein